MNEELKLSDNIVKFMIFGLTILGMLVGILGSKIYYSAKINKLEAEVSLTEDLENTAVYEVVGFTNDGSDKEYVLYDSYNETYKIVETKTYLFIGDECIIVDGKVFKID